MGRQDLTKGVGIFLNFKKSWRKMHAYETVWKESLNQLGMSCGTFRKSLPGCSTQSFSAGFVCTLLIWLKFWNQILAPLRRSGQGPRISAVGTAWSELMCSGCKENDSSSQSFIELIKHMDKLFWTWSEISKHQNLLKVVNTSQYRVWMPWFKELPSKPERRNYVRTQKQIMFTL